MLLADWILLSAISYVFDMCTFIASCEMMAQRATLKPLLSNNSAQNSSIACLGSCLHAGVCTSVNVSALIPRYVRRCGLDRFQGKFFIPRFTNKKKFKH